MNTPLSVSLFLIFLSQDYLVTTAAGLVADEKMWDDQSIRGSMN